MVVITGNGAVGVKSSTSTSCESILRSNTTIAKYFEYRKRKLVFEYNTALIVNKT